MTKDTITAKVEEKVAEFCAFEVEAYGKWRIDRHVAAQFLRESLTEIATLARKEGRDYTLAQLYMTAISGHDDQRRKILLEAHKALTN